MNAASNPSNGLGPQTPFDEAARVVLDRRLRSVEEALQRLRRGAAEDEIDADAVHRVRVSVRRTSAALAVFAPCIGRQKTLAKARKGLRRLRRSVGEARSCDVNLALLEHDAAAGEGADHETRSLRRRLRRTRAELVRDLRGSVRAYSDRKLAKWRGRLTRELRAPETSPTLADAARSSLGATLSEVIDAGAQNLADAERLHSLRLAVKRLRYSAEVFGPCFEPERLDALLASLAGIQDRLGAANDLSEVASLLDDHGVDPALIESYRRRFEESRNQFIGWWRSAGLRQLETLLGPSGPAEGRFGPLVVVRSITPREVGSDEGEIRPMSPASNGSDA